MSARRACSVSLHIFRIRVSLILDCTSGDEVFYRIVTNGRIRTVPPAITNPRRFLLGASRKVT